MTQRAQQLIEANRRSQNPTLDLGNCGLTEWPDLSGMDWLETLILSHFWYEFDEAKREWVRFVNPNSGQPNILVVSPPAIPYLPRLRKLVAGNLGIIDGLFLENLPNLTTLYLRNSQISEGRFLEKLLNLTTLDLSNNQINDWHFLENLPNLTTLYLRNNQISKGHFLEKLTNLTTLDLRDNKINNADCLGNLISLTTLDLRNNQINDGHFLEKLINLTTLFLSYNQISSWHFLEKLTNLTTLDLSDSEINDGRFLENLTNLTKLNLRNNHISDSCFLKKLTNLSWLDLFSNQISDGHFLEKLTNLTWLDLSYNKISNWSFVENLTNLTTLNLSYNKISNGHFLEKLTSLTTLYLRENKISDTRFLEKLTELTSLDISNNRVEDLSPLLHLVKKGIPVKWNSGILDQICVLYNPFTNPPVDIVQQGNEAILNYFNQIAEQGGTAPLYEAKLIMVGEPGAGKTSLTEKLLDERHVVRPDDPDKKSTLGINVRGNWLFGDCRRPGEDFTAHIWDFGGQEIQYMTHQFFLTPESMYVLVADDRKQHTLFPYWFEVIRLLGKDELSGHSPVLVVLNERNNKSITNFDLNDYRLRYPDMDIQVCEVDLCDDNLSRFRRLRQQVQERLCHLPHIGRALPAKWPRIREDLSALKAQGHNHISMARFREVCAAHKVVRDEDLALISLYLHRLGAILHFQQDRSLRDFIVISPAWALKAMYAVLEDKAVEKANGFFTEQDLDRYWRELTDAERDNVLKMMKKESFEIVYPVDGGYIAPQLLSKVRPAFEWDSSQCLKCRFYYRFMPKGILTRLIVRKHAHIKVQALVWARGVVLHFAGCDILVVEQETEKDGIIQIEVLGKGRDGIRALDFVRNEIEEIHHKWFRDIDFQPMVPCDCPDCHLTAEPTYFKLESLIKRLDQRRSYIECENGQVKEVPVRRLLEGVYHTEDIAQKVEQERHTNIHVYAQDPKVHERLERLERTAEAIEMNTHLIQSNQHVQTRLLETALEYAEKEQALLLAVSAKIDAFADADNTELARIDALLQEQFGRLVEQLPDEHRIAAAWKAASDLPPAATDLKWTLKFKINLIFAEFEKDLAWDGKKVLKSIREEFRSFYKGERSLRELFWED